MHWLALCEKASQLRYLFLFLPVFAYGVVTPGEWIRIIREDHPFYLQTGQVLTTSDIGAAVDYDGDGQYDQGGGVAFFSINENWIIVPDPNETPDHNLTSPFNEGDTVYIIGFVGEWHSRGIPKYEKFVIKSFDENITTSTPPRLECTILLLSTDQEISGLPINNPWAKAMLLWEDKDRDGINDIPGDPRFPVDEDPTDPEITNDTDQDGVDDLFDIDDDGDGILDHLDHFPKGEDGTINVGGGDGNINTGGTGTVTTNDDGIITSVGNIDTDNDVPTLLQILEKLDSFKSENTSLLSQLVNAEINGTSGKTVDDLDVSIGVDGVTSKLPEEQLSGILEQAGGALPNTSMQIGDHYFSFDLQDPKFATAMLIAKAGLTSVVVIGSFSMTWKLSTILIST